MNTLQFDKRKYKFMSILDAGTSFLTCKQGLLQVTNKYLEELKEWASAIKYFGGNILEFRELQTCAQDCR